MKPKSKILIIAGSDSSGGAGIQADIKTVTALGSYAMTAITAVTTQNTTGVKSIIPIPHKEISKQIEFTCNDIKPDAMQAKIFAFFPLFLTVILAPFPSGLVIYWTVNNILTMAQQVFIMKRTTIKTVT